MKAKNCDILFVPGHRGASEDHWLSRWAHKLSTGRRVEVPSGDRPNVGEWTGRLTDAVEGCDKPVVIVGHGLGAALTARDAHALAERVIAAFLVAPHALEDEVAGAFGPHHREPLPFPSVVVASRADPDAPFDEMEDLAGAWGSLFVDAGEIGGIDESSGHGPWPEGSLTFARFLNQLPERH